MLAFTGILLMLPCDTAQISLLDYMTREARG